MSSEVKPGGKIGDRVARLVSESAMNTRIHMGPHMSRVAVNAMNTFMDGIGREAQGTSGEVWDQLRKTGLLPPWADRTAEFAQTRRGEWSALLNMSGISGGVANSLLNLINNELAPPVNALISKNPQGLLDPGTSAQALARGMMDFNFAYTEGARGGVNSDRMAILADLSRALPDLGSLQEMVNRGMLDEAAATQVLTHMGFEQKWRTRLLSLRFPRFAPEQLAALVTFGVLSEAQGAERAHQSGMGADDFHLLVEGNGQPPATGDLLAAYRRNIIDHDRLLRGIEQGPVRNEWFDVIERLRYSPPSADVALNAATQNLIPADRAKKIVAQNGVDPSDFDWLLETYGRPLGISEAAELFNRGVLSAAAARQMFLESNIKNKYVPLVFRLFERIPPMDEIRIAYREGAIDRAEGLRRLRALGYSIDDANMLLDMAAAQKHATNKNLSDAVIRELYQDGAITLADAKEGLSANGWDAGEVNWLLALDDLQVARRTRNAAISKVHTRYVAHRVEPTVVVTLLDQLGVPPAQRDQLIDTWDIERESTVAHLSTAQITAALKRGLLSESEAFGRLVRAGYDEDDAGIIIALASPVPRA